MQTSHNRRWKIVMQCLGIPIYVFGAIHLSFLVWALVDGGPSYMLRNYWFLYALGGLWVVIGAFGVWKLIVILSEESLFRAQEKGDMTKTEILVLKSEILVLVSVILICLIFGIGPWYFSGGLAWLGGPNPSTICFCDFSCPPYNMCTMTQTAVAARATPPAWWPWRNGTPPP